MILENGHNEMCMNRMHPKVGESMVSVLFPKMSCGVESTSNMTTYRVLLLLAALRNSECTLCCHRNSKNKGFHRMRLRQHRRTASHKIAIVRIMPGSFGDYLTSWTPVLAFHSFPTTSLPSSDLTITLRPPSEGLCSI